MKKCKCKWCREYGSKCEFCINYKDNQTHGYLEGEGMCMAKTHDFWVEMQDEACEKFVCDSTIKK